MPYFSIIIPVFNRASLIGKTIDGVLAQTFRDFEVIIVDDGSTDHLKDVMLSYSSDQISYVYQENGERGKARNTGVNNASGTYVFFLDSDDLIYPDHLEHAYDCIQALKEPAFFHSRYEERFLETTRQVEQLNEQTLPEIIKKRNVFACQFFLRRSLALEFPFSTNRALKIGEDWEVILHIAARHPLHFSNKVTAAIVQHEARSMQVADAKTILQSKEIILQRLQKDEKITTEIRNNVAAELTTLAALAAAIANDKKSAFQLWRTGVKLSSHQRYKRRSLAILKKIIFNGKA